MNGWFAQNTDYVLFLILVTGLWIGLGLWLHRTGRLPSLPKFIWVLLAVVTVGGWWGVDSAGYRAQDTIRRQVELLVPFYVEELQQIGHARLPDNPPPGDPLYERLIQTEISWLKLNPAIADIYTFRRRADGAIFLLVDSETGVSLDQVAAASTAVSGRELANTQYFYGKSRRDIYGICKRRLRL